MRGIKTYSLVRTSLCDVKGVPGKKNPSDSSEMSYPSFPGINHGKENIEILENFCPSTEGR